MSAKSKNIGGEALRAPITDAWKPRKISSKLAVSTRSPTAATVDIGKHSASPASPNTGAKSFQLQVGTAAKCCSQNLSVTGFQGDGEGGSERQSNSQFPLKGAKAGSISDPHVESRQSGFDPRQGAIRAVVDTAAASQRPFRHHSSRRLRAGRASTKSSPNWLSRRIAVKIRPNLCVPRRFHRSRRPKPSHPRRTLSVHLFSTVVDVFFQFQALIALSDLNWGLWVQIYWRTLKGLVGLQAMDTFHLLIPQPRHHLRLDLVRP